MFSSFWQYRFTKRFNVRADLRYQDGKRDGNNEDSYNINLGGNYGTLIKGFDLETKYLFSIGELKRFGEIKYITHNLGLGITKRFRWGKVYADYDFFYRTINYKLQPLEQTDFRSRETTDTEHTFLIGASGRGPFRTYGLAKQKRDF